MAIGVVVFIFSFGLSGIVSHITKRDILWNTEGGEIMKGKHRSFEKL